MRKDTFDLLVKVIAEAEKLNSLMEEINKSVAKVLSVHSPRSVIDMEDWAMDCVYNKVPLKSVLKDLNIKVQR